MGAFLENYSLVWEDFKENVTKNFSDLRDDRQFSDVTLVCEDNQHVLAHRVVLSSCSPLLSSVLRKLSQPQPFIYFWGVRAVQLEAVMDFCYKGQVNVTTRELEEFIRVAKILGIKGITGGDNIEDKSNLGGQSIPNIPMENIILVEEDVKIEEPKLASKDINLTENTHERVESAKEKNTMFPISLLDDFYLVDKNNKNIAKCNKCGKIVQSYLREAKRKKFSQAFMRDHLRLHKEEFEQFTLIQRQIKLQRKQKFSKDLEEIERKISLEYGFSIGKEYTGKENCKLEHEANKPITNSKSLKSDLDLLSEETSKTMLACKYSNCGFIGHKMRRHEKNKHEKRNIPILCTKNFCTKTFDTLPEFNKHRETCVLKCSWKQCGKEFRNSERYTRHQSVHPAGVKVEFRNVNSKHPNTNINQHILTNEDAKNKLKGIWGKLQFKPID